MSDIPSFKDTKSFQVPIQGEPFTDWPEIEEILYDGLGNSLEVTEVNPRDSLGRHIAGKINSINSYSCDVNILIRIWRRKR